MWGIEMGYGRIRQCSIVVEVVMCEGEVVGLNPTSRVDAKNDATCDLLT